MGRKKSYDREELVAKAMELFRDHGLAGTSAEMLVDELGVNRFSLYREFGSKQGLFDAALQRYDDTVIDQSYASLEADGAGVAEVRALLDFYANASEGAARGRGCLLCNTAVEFGPDDPSGQGYVQRYFARLAAAFGRALHNAKKSGELRSSIDVAAEADFFTATVLGIFVMLRAEAPPTAIRHAANAATAHLEALCMQPA